MQVSAQAPESIASDRPGNAFSALTVGKYLFQAQIGADYGGSSFDGGSISDYNLLSSFFRYGLGKSFEISGQVDYRHDRFSLSKNLNGISNLGVGLRYNFLRSTGGGPDIGALLTVSFSQVLKDYETTNEVPGLIIVVQQPLPANFGLTVNLGASLVDPERDVSGIYVLNLGYGLSEEVSVFIESYGTFDNRDFIRNYDAGLAYLLSKDIQLDFYAGATEYQKVFSYFASLGVSIRTGAGGS